MPHIFFERLERRRSTQSLMGNIPTNGLLGSSSYASSAPSSISSPYALPREPMIYCYAVWIPPDTFEPPKPFKPEPPKLPIWKIPWPFPTQPSWQMPWLNPPFTSPSWDYLNNWLSPIQNNWQSPFNYTPSWNSIGNWTSPIMNYPQTPSIPTYPWNTYMYNLSKSNSVRKGLLAFFQKKGILSDKQEQRLLSKPFDKA